VLSGCLREAPPTSTIQTDTLATGLWFELLPVFDRDDAELVRTRARVQFLPDGTFTATKGLPGVPIPNLSGRFWGRDAFIGSRGVGEASGIHIKFHRIEVLDGGLQLALSDVLDQGILGRLESGALLDRLSASQIGDIVDQLNENPPATSEMGPVVIYTSE
jgi:hypothetical protein